MQNTQSSLKKTSYNGSFRQTKLYQKIKNTLPILILRSGRPRQWLKNLALFAPLVFSGSFFLSRDGVPYFSLELQAFLIFSLLTSCVYIINDIIDREADRQHPFKKKRPIASGRLSVPIATGTVAIGLILVFYFSLSMVPYFTLFCFLYLLLQVVYAKFTKHLPILDVLSIATGFLIRIYSGAVVIDVNMSVWFLLTVVSASLFLAVGKRQSERTLMQHHLGKTRSTLRHYSQRLLDQYTSMFATATWMSYALYTFNVHTSLIRPAYQRFSLLYQHLPRTLQSQKLLMLTIPLVIFGIMRYLALVYEENRGESPEIVLLRDKTLLTTVAIYAIMTMLIIYA